MVAYNPLTPARAVWARLWTDAPAEQSKLTTQLARNSFYFTAACIIIRQFGEYVNI